MGDSGEGLVDAEARIQERMDELEAERKARLNTESLDPVEAQRALSKQLVRANLVDQLTTATHPVRRAQLEAAIADIDKV